MHRGLSLGIIFLVIAGCSAKAEPRSLNEGLRQYLKAQLKGETDIRVSVAQVDLSGQSPPEVIVYLQGPGRCGSGGCDMMILQPSGRGYRLVTETSITRLPIRELTSRTHGWHDLAVTVAGGGIRSPRSAILRFDGRGYPENPSMTPRTSARGGKVLIRPDDEGVPLR